MKRYLLILLSIVSAVAQAQTNLVTGNSLEAYWNLPLSTGQAQTVLKLGTTNLPATSAINETILNQQGVSNAAVLSVLAGTQNRLEVNQSTGPNSTDATLIGNNNSVLLNQTGAGNSISLGLTGNNNQYLLSQDGGDRIQMLGLQKDNTHLEVSQGNGNNSLTIDNTSVFSNSSGIGNLRIEQVGGANITVQQGRVIGN